MIRATRLLLSFRSVCRLVPSTRMSPTVCPPIKGNSSPLDSGDNHRDSNPTAIETIQLRSCQTARSRGSHDNAYLCHENSWTKPVNSIEFMSGMRGSQHNSPRPTPHAPKEPPTRRKSCGTSPTGPSGVSGFIRCVSFSDRDVLKPSSAATNGA